MRSLLLTAVGASTLFAIGFNSPQQEELPAPVARPVAPQVPAIVVPAGQASTFEQSSPRYFTPGLATTHNYSYAHNHATSREEAKLNRQINQAVAALKSDDEDKRSKAASDLQTAVENLFDARTKSRTKQIEELEARIKKLRKQVSQRSSKKEEICRLYVDTLVNKAKGLGF